MKKLIVFLVVVALIGFGGWQLYVRVFNPDYQTCNKLAELCAKGKDFTSKHMDSCQSGLDNLREVIGDDKARKAGKCVVDAESCIGAVGCMTGAGLGGAAVEFFNGMRGALQD